MNASASESMTPAQRAIWAIICLVILAIVVVRSFIGDGMGRVYVEPKPMDFVVETTTGEDGASTTSSRQLSPEEFEAFTSANPEVETVSWIEYDQVAPKEYFAQEAAGGGDIIMSWPRTIGLWLAAFFTLAIFSFLYRDNPFYKFAESVVVGVSAGYWMVVGFWDTIVPNLLQRLMPAFSKDYLTPGMELPPGGFDAPIWSSDSSGARDHARRSPALKCGGRLWPLAFIVRTCGCAWWDTSGDILSQPRAVIPPRRRCFLLDLHDDLEHDLGEPRSDPSGDRCPGLSRYFFFSVVQSIKEKPLIGIWYLMITFGAAFGFTVMGRIALLAARVEFLFDDWMWLIDPMQQREFITSSVGLLL